MKRTIYLTFVLMLALIVSACAPTAPAPAAQEAAPAATEEVMEEPTAEAVEEEGAMADGEMMDIVDTAVAAGSFTTLAAALDAAGLIDTLKGEGPFTVFAPTDDAFAALPEGTVESLLEDPSGALTDILLYHVVPGKVMAADVLGMDGEMAETVGGGMLTITIGDDGSVMINDATVTTADVETSNGVIHIIDSVLLPPVAE
ncbi:MAG: fasciclin domain-containing protein [Caldilineaceae bacterium]|nr:fasciclin domain-containing protein [Caldilineaceae bacterium]